MSPDALTAHQQVQKLAAEKAELVAAIHVLCDAWEEDGHDSERFSDLFDNLVCLADGYRRTTT